MAFFSGIGAILESCYQNKNDKETILCDYTETAIKGCVNDLSWLDIKKLENNTIRFYAGAWNNTKTDAFLRNSINYDYARSKANGDENVSIPFCPYYGDVIELKSKTSLIVLDTEWALPGFEDDLPEQLPLNVNLTVAGILSLNKGNWDDALRLFTEAYKKGNGVASYYLYFMYSNRFGMEQDDESIQHLQNSADLGYRKAQLEFGKKLLSKGSDIDIALGIRYLKKATYLSDFRSPFAGTTLVDAISEVQDYYLGTEQYKKAYSFTKDLIKDYKLEWLKYFFHLDNCLLVGNYSESLDIIRKGVNSSDAQDAGYCKVIQAKMFCEGLGVTKDLRKAELALRFASDSLDSPLARKKLSELYLQEGYHNEAEFWQRLYDIRFRSAIYE